LQARLDCVRWVHQHGLNEASATTRDGLLPVHQLPMFYTAAAFNEDISAWNTAKVITTNGAALAFRSPQAGPEPGMEYV
jgi:surface protein